VHNCWAKDDEATENVQTNFEGKVHYTDHISEDQNSQQSQISAINDNMGSLMSDTCQAGKQAKSCFQSCPNSQLKDVALGSYYVDDVACEPDKNFGGYNGYRTALFCINNTLSRTRDACISRCHGGVKDLKAVTQFAVDRDDGDSASVNVESDSGKNFNSVRDQCKITICNRDCNKDEIVRKCGQNGYNLYDRQLKVEPRSTLTVLQKLSVLSSVPPECNQFK